MTLINDYAPLVLRICLVMLFPFSGLDKILNWDSAMKQAGNIPFKPGHAGGLHHRRVRYAGLHRRGMA